MQHSQTPNALFQPTLPDHLQSVLDDITARNRARFGHDAYRMEDSGGDGGGSGDGGGAGDGGGSGDAGKGDQGGDSGKAKGKDDGDGGDPQDVSELPDWAQKLIKDTRDEAAKHRTSKTTAEQKYQETLDNIGKALGLKDDGEKDPEKLAGELTKAQQAQRETAVELAVYRAAGKHQGDPDALLDSRTFLAKVRDLDPSESDFSDKVGEAIKSAVADNPKLKTAPAAGKGGAELNGGSGEGASKDKPKTLDAAVRKHYDA